MLLSFSLALLAQSPQSPIAPPASPQLPKSPQAQQQQGNPILNHGESAGDGMLGTNSIEAFETAIVPVGGTLNTAGVNVLDESTILNDGQGPNIVLNGCSYTTAGSQFQFNGASYFGMPSNTVCGVSDATCRIDYDYPQFSVSMALNAFDGFPDTADVIAYDAGGNIVAQAIGLALPDAATQVPVTLSGVGIVRVDVVGTAGWTWSPLMDDHVYSPDPNAFEGFETPNIPVGTAFNNGASIDDTSILGNGEGPGMLEDGCTYTSEFSTIQWNGQGWFGQNSETILSSSGSLILDYDYPQNGVRMTLNAFAGFADDATVTAYNSGGGVLTTISGITLDADASKVSVFVNANGITRIEVDSSIQSWSPLLDNHDYVDAPPSVEKFEQMALGLSTATNIGVAELDDDTVASNGQGPNLVRDGATYSAGSGSIQWNGRDWFGQSSQNIISSSNGGLLEVRYDSIQSRVSFTLCAFDGFADTASATAYSATGAVVDTVGGIVLNDGNPVPVSLSSSGGIARIEVQGTAHSWSPLFDNHNFTGWDYALDMSIVGPCPGVQTVTVTGGRPGAGAKLLYSAQIGGSVLTAGICAGTPTELAGNIKLLNPVFFYDANGEFSASNFTPPGACGVIFIQMVDQDCNLSNVIKL